MRRMPHVTETVGACVCLREKTIGFYNMMRAANRTGVHGNAAAERTSSVAQPSTRVLESLVRESFVHEDRWRRTTLLQESFACGERPFFYFPLCHWASALLQQENRS